ncbi:MAG: hypothetical protein ABEJ43_04545 [Haloferacaceae archaeon]
MSPPPDEVGPGPANNPYVDEVAAAARTAEAGPLFDEAYRPGESGATAGLVAGAPDDPVLVAGVGYPLLGDLAVGTVVAYRVAEWNLPDVAVADCSNTPVAAYQTITDGDHETLVVVGPEKRGGELNDGTPSETPGAVHEYGPEDFEAPDDRLVDLVGESAMGSNTVENVLVVSRALGELPSETNVITVEPGYDSWGLTVEEFTDPVEAVLDDVLERVLGYIEDAAG